MTVLHLNSQDNGGAALASLSLHGKLLENGIESQYLAMDNNLNLKDINYILPFLPSKFNLNYLYKRHLYQKYYRRRYAKKIKTIEHISFPFSNIDITNHKLYKEADIIHIHNIAEFVDIPSFLKKNTKPIVATLHDFYLLNGLFHIYEKNELDDNTLQVLAKYKKMMEELLKFDIKLVAPSNSVKKAAFRQNSLFTDKIEIIYHGIDKSKFYPVDKSYAKDKLKINQNLKVILLIADDFARKNKNFKIILDLLASSNFEDIYILAIGNNFSAIQNNSSISYKSLEYSQNYKMNELYSAADLTIVPSLFETFSMVTLESIACGTPVVGFDNSGPSEIISHQENGYLAEFEDYDDFMDGIQFCLNNFNDTKVKIDDEEFDINHSVNKYIELYNSII